MEHLWNGIKVPVRVAGERFWTGLKLTSRLVASVVTGNAAAMRNVKADVEAWHTSRGHIGG